MRQKLPAPEPPRSTSVSADEVLSLREFGRRLGLGVRALCDCQRNGLPTTVIGKKKYIVGSEAVEWFRKRGQQQAGGPADE